MWKDLIKNPYFIAGGSSTLGLVVGGVAGYALSVRRWRETVETSAQIIAEYEKNLHEASEALAKSLDEVGEELEEVADLTEGINEVSNAVKDLGETVAEPLTLDRTVQEAPQTTEYNKPVEIEKPVEPAAPPEEYASLFKQDESDDWDWTIESKRRAATTVYQIHTDEFMQNESEFDQSTITFYAGDGVMCDERDVPIYNHEAVTGQVTFGKGTTDPNVAYVRNNVLKAEYEILFHPGHYLVEVLGETIEAEFEEAELKHSQQLRKFKE